MARAKTPLRVREALLAPLRHGERLRQPAFHARYEAMAPGVKAELIGGEVYVMPSPVTTSHARYHLLAVSWLSDFEAGSVGVRAASDATLILNAGNEPQPDALLWVLPEYGGQAHAAGNYLEGAPELVLEVAVSSKAYDLREKRAVYERAGVSEYVVVLAEEGEVRWHVLERGRYMLLTSDADGILRSRRFPGLWLDPQALVAEDLHQLKAVCQAGLNSPAQQAVAPVPERAGVSR